MSETSAPAASVAATRRPWPWLVVIGLVGLLGVAWIWSMRGLGQICTLQYPAPPGCGAVAPGIVPTVVMALVVAGFVVAAIAWFLASPRRLTLILVIVAASIVAVVLIGALAIWMSMSVTYYPPVLY
jgi:hypothetical protein